MSEYHKILLVLHFVLHGIKGYEAESSVFALIFFITDFNNPVYPSRGNSYCLSSRLRSHFAALAAAS